jgi:4-hydroxybenzoate polyprenyltransferase
MRGRTTAIAAETVESANEAAASATVVTRRGAAGAVLTALRPAEWLKNLLVFTAVLFSGHVTFGRLGEATLAFVAFCAAASAGYLVNDLRDIELDRRHPRKCRRPVASGALPARAAGLLAALLAVVGLGLAAAAGWLVVAVLAAYMTTTAAYSLALKRVVILDVMVIAGLFLLRVVGGAVAVDVHASRWLLVCTGMLAMFLGFTKRRQEAASELHDGTLTRPVLEHYSLPFLDQMVSMSTAGTVLAYVIYAQQSPIVGDRMLFTVPAVVYGCFRYLYLIYQREDERPTSALLVRDPGMLCAAAAWIAIAAAVLYL